MLLSCTNTLGIVTTCILSCVSNLTQPHHQTYKHRPYLWVETHHNIILATLDSGKVFLAVVLTEQFWNFVVKEQMKILSCQILTGHRYLQETEFGRAEL